MEHTQYKPFKYDALKGRELRLFQLDLDGEDEELSGKLMTAKLTTTLSDIVRNVVKFPSVVAESNFMKAVSGSEGYTALSYVWGKQPERFPLKLVKLENNLTKDGEAISEADPERSGYVWITASLRDFLWRMRKEKFIRFLWIDAICIVQDSNADKDVQIPRMRDVYQGAESVYVWLGDGIAAESERLSQLLEVNNKLDLFSDDLISRGKLVQDPDVSSAFVSVGLLSASDVFWRIMSRLLASPWWCRLWVLQEVVVATHVTWAKDYGSSTYKPPMAMVLYGSAHVEWYQIERFVFLIERLGLAAWLKSRQGGSEQEDLHALSGIAEIQTCRYDFGWSVSPGTALLATRRRKATMPEDMVIGIQAMLDGYTIRKLALSSSMPVHQVFVRFGRHYVQAEPRECLLNHLATNRRLPGLPSWCPDFSSSEVTNSIGARLLGRHVTDEDYPAFQMPCAGFKHEGKWAMPMRRFELGRTLVNVFTAKNPNHNLYDTGTPRSLQSVDEHSAMRASGMSLDFVTSVVKCNPAAESADFLSLDSLAQTQAWDEECLALARATLTEDSPGFDIYARTITANRITMSALDNNTRVWKPVYDRDLQQDRAKQYLRFRRFMQDSLSAGATDASDMDADTLRFTHCLHQMSRRRTFFATIGGRIGLGCEDVQVGDELAVFFFCPTPYLLRPREKREKETLFVGEAYVHGLMYGEALDMLDRGEVQETQWVLT